MYRICKTIELESGHLLSKHPGSCQFPHGHTRSVELVFAAETLDENDMVMDFKDVKNICEETVLSKFDHAFIYDETSAGESEIAAVVVKNGMRAAALPFRSTAENLAKWIFEALKVRIPCIHSVRVYETADSCAEYSA